MTTDSSDSDRSGVRRNYPKGVARRGEILAAALEVIAEQGSQRAYISEVAHRVGLTPAGLLHHFGSREELFQEVVRARDEHDYAVLAASPVGIEGFFTVIEHNQAVPGLVQLYAEFAAEAASRPDHPAREFFQRRYESLIDALAGDVATAQHAGEMGQHVDPRAAATTMVSAADGLQVQWLLDRRIDMIGRLRGVWRTLCVASFVEDDPLQQVE